VVVEEQIEPQHLAGKLVAWTGLAGRERESPAECVRRLGAVQIDPVQVVAPAHLWTLSLRRGPTTAADVDQALARGEVLEAYCHARCLVHRDDLAALVPKFRQHRAGNYAARYGVQREAQDLLERLEREGTVVSGTLESSRKVVGGWDRAGDERTKATSAALEVLWREGRIAVVSRTGGQKRYALMAQHLPELDRLIADAPSAEVERAAVRHAVRTLGVVGPGGLAPLWSGGEVMTPKAWMAQLVDAREVRPVRVGQERFLVWAALLEEAIPRHRRAVLLAPLDNVLWHRPRLEALWQFRYRWEIYTPASRRRVGPYNMPVLWGTRFWGEADARWVGEGLTTRLLAADPGGEERVPAAVGHAVRRAQNLARRLRQKAPAG